MAERTSLGRVGVVLRGEYSPETHYLRLDIVYEGKGAYICRKDCTGEPVTNAEYWQIIVTLDDVAENVGAATGAANQAAQAANTAAESANTAAGFAQSVADMLAVVDMTVEMLAPSAEPTAEVVQTANSTTFNLGVPMSNVAYATFEIDEAMDLNMYTPDGYAGVGFEIDEDGELEVIING